MMNGKINLKMKQSLYKRAFIAGSKSEMEKCSEDRSKPTFLEDPVGGVRRWFGGQVQQIAQPTIDAAGKKVNVLSDNLKSMAAGVALGQPIFAKILDRIMPSKKQNINVNIDGLKAKPLKKVYAENYKVGM